MNHLVVVDNDVCGDSKLVSRIKLDLKNAGITFTDSDMFKYCDIYTGCFWDEDIKMKA